MLIVNWILIARYQAEPGNADLEALPASIWQFIGDVLVSLFLVIGCPIDYHNKNRSFVVRTLVREHLRFAKSIFFIIVRASPLASCTIRERGRSHYSKTEMLPFNPILFAD